LLVSSIALAAVYSKQAVEAVTLWESLVIVRRMPASQHVYPVL
jgi:hypothetical protein